MVVLVDKQLGAFLCRCAKGGTGGGGKLLLPYLL